MSVAGVIREDGEEQHIMSASGPEVIIHKYESWHIWKQKVLPINNTWLQIFLKKINK